MGRIVVLEREREREREKLRCHQRRVQKHLSTGACKNVIQILPKRRLPYCIMKQLFVPNSYPGGQGEPRYS